MEIENLKKELAKKESTLRKSQLKKVFQEYGLKEGDEVEFIVPGDSYNNIESEWRKGNIFRFDFNRDLIYAKIGHTDVLIQNIKKFKSDFYEMRHSVWNRELEVGDQIKLLVDKPKSTKGKIYNIYSVYKTADYDIEYAYYDNYGKKQFLYEGEFHLTHP